MHVRVHRDWLAQIRNELLIEIESLFEIKMKLQRMVLMDQQA